MAVKLDEDALEELKETIADVRDKEVETNWVAVGHHPDKRKTLTLCGSGEDLYDGIRELAADDKVLYFLAKDEDIFIFVQWVGPSVGALKKAQTAFERTHVRNLFGNCHVEILAEESDDLSNENFDEKTSYHRKTSGRVRGNSVDEGSRAKLGMKQRYIHASLKSTDSPAKGEPARSGMASSDKTIEVEDREDFIEEIAAFREGEVEYDWLVIGYKEGETTSVKTGSADGETIQKKVLKLSILERVEGDIQDWEGLADDGIFYCLGSKEEGATNRFYLINWQGSGVNLARKAAASTHRGILSEVIRVKVPHFTEVPAESRDEITAFFEKL